MMLQVRLPSKRSPNFLETTFKAVQQQQQQQPQDHNEHSCGNGSGSNSNDSSIQARRVVVGTPNLSSAGAAAALEALLPEGRPVSLLLWPSCVWSNSRFTGVTLNCVEAWLG